MSKATNLSVSQHVYQEATRYPHVYANTAAAEAASAFGSKVLLPIGTTKTEYDVSLN